MNRECIAEISDTSSITSLLQWIKLLNFTEQHQDDLFLSELRILADASERHRLFWNEDQTQNNTKTRTGLGIERQDVNPNIHRMIEAKERLLENEQNKNNNNIESPLQQVVMA